MQIKSSIGELDVGQIFFKQPGYFGECVMIIEELIKKILINESKSTKDFELINILIRQQTNTDIIAFKRLLTFIYNSDLINTYLFYKAMIEFQKTNKTKSSWIFAESSHVLIDILKNELLSAVEVSTDCPNDFIFNVEKSVFQLRIEQHTEKVEESIDNTDIELNEDLVSLDDSESCGLELNAISAILESSSLANFYLLNIKIKKTVGLLDEYIGNKILVLVANRSVRKSVKNALSSIGRINIATIMTHYEFQFLFEDFDLVILMCPDLGSIRHIEYLSSVNTPIKTIIYQYKNSIEEQRYLQELREEKDAFEILIDKRGRIPLRTCLDKIEMDEDSEEDRFNVVVDSREMRAKLPFFLYKAGNSISIKVLELGDYLIGKNKCIERKSIDDFIASLNTGRLYQQAQRLTHSYKSPILLLEFNDCKPVLSDFDNYEDPKSSCIARFCLFLYTFPSFLLIWSNSPLQSVRMIRDIQRKSSIEDTNESEIDPVLHELLLCIPGISSFNVVRVCREFKNLKDLAFADQYRIERTMDPVSAAKVYNFFREKFVDLNKAI